MLESSVTPKEEALQIQEDLPDKRVSFRRQGTSFDIVYLPPTPEKLKGALFEEHSNYNVEPEKGK